MPAAVVSIEAIVPPLHAFPCGFRAAESSLYNTWLPRVACTTRPSPAVVLRRFPQPVGTSLHAFLMGHDARCASERGRAQVFTAKPERVDRLVEVPLALRRSIRLVEVAVDPP